MSSFRFPVIRLAWTLFSLLLLMNLAVGLAFASSDCSDPENFQEDPSESLHFTGRVVKFSITDPSLVDIDLEEGVWILHIRIKSRKEGEKTRLKEGDILKAYSSNKLSSHLHGEIVKATVERRLDEYWLVRVLPLPPENLPLDNKLYGLIFAATPEEYAQKKGIELRTNKAKVVIEKSDKTEFSTECKVDIERQSQSLVRAWVPIESLVCLARESQGVAFVRLPYSHSPHN